MGLSFFQMMCLKDDLWQQEEVKQNGKEIQNKQILDALRTTEASRNISAHQLQVLKQNFPSTANQSAIYYQIGVHANLVRPCNYMMSNKSIYILHAAINQQFHKIR